MTARKDTNPVAPAAGPTKESVTTPGPELSVIVPTRNEHDNVRPVYDGLCRTLQGIDWEAIFVDDDSEDGTPEAVCRLANQDRRVRLRSADWPPRSCFRLRRRNLVELRALRRGNGCRPAA